MFGLALSAIGLFVLDQAVPPSGPGRDGVEARSKSRPLRSTRRRMKCGWNGDRSDIPAVTTRREPSMVLHALRGKITQFACNANTVQIEGSGQTMRFQQSIRDTKWGLYKTPAYYKKKASALFCRPPTLNLATQEKAHRISNFKYQTSGCVASIKHPTLVSSVSIPLQAWHGGSRS